MTSVSRSSVARGYAPRSSLLAALLAVLLLGFRRRCAGAGGAAARRPTARFRGPPSRVVTAIRSPTAAEHGLGRASLGTCGILAMTRTARLGLHAGQQGGRPGSVGHQPGRRPRRRPRPTSSTRWASRGERRRTIVPLSGLHARVRAGTSFIAFELNQTRRSVDQRADGDRYPVPDDGRHHRDLARSRTMTRRRDLAALDLDGDRCGQSRAARPTVGCSKTGTYTSFDATTCDAQGAVNDGRRSRTSCRALPGRAATIRRGAVRRGGAESDGAASRSSTARQLLLVRVRPGCTRALVRV